MSLTPRYWGEPIWKTLYIIAYTCPENPTEDHCFYIDTQFINTGHLLPCDDCQEHYYKFLEEYPIERVTHDRKKLLTWVNSLENAVNRKLQRPVVSLETRIAEMDRNNPDLIKKTTPSTATTKKRPPPFLRHGGVSYGIRSSNNKPTTSHQAPLPLRTAPVQATRRNPPVRYGIRNPNRVLRSKAGCGSCRGREWQSQGN